VSVKEGNLRPNVWCLKMQRLYRDAREAAADAAAHPGDLAKRQRAEELIDDCERHHAGAIGAYMKTLYAKTAAAVQLAKDYPKDEGLAEAATTLVNARERHHAGVVKGGKTTAARVNELRNAAEGEADAMAAFERIREGRRWFCSDSCQKTCE